MDLLDLLAVTDSPAYDTATGNPIPRGQRCPDCGATAYGPGGALNATTTPLGNSLFRTRSHCFCRRLTWDETYDTRKAVP